MDQPQNSISATEYLYISLGTVGGLALLLAFLISGAVFWDTDVIRYARRRARREARIHSTGIANPGGPDLQHPEVREMQQPTAPLTVPMAVVQPHPLPEHGTLVGRQSLPPPYTVSQDLTSPSTHTFHTAHSRARSSPMQTLFIAPISEQPTHQYPDMSVRGQPITNLPNDPVFEAIKVEEKERWLNARIATSNPQAPGSTAAIYQNSHVSQGSSSRDPSFIAGPLIAPNGSGETETHSSHASTSNRVSDDQTQAVSTPSDAERRENDKEQPGQQRKSSSSYSLNMKTETPDKVISRFDSQMKSVHEEVVAGTTDAATNTDASTLINTSTTKSIEQPGKAPMKKNVADIQEVVHENYITHARNIPQKGPPATPKFEKLRNHSKQASTGSNDASTTTNTNDLILLTTFSLDEERETAMKKPANIKQTGETSVKEQDQEIKDHAKQATVTKSTFYDDSEKETGKQCTVEDLPEQPEHTETSVLQKEEQDNYSDSEALKPDMENSDTLSQNLESQHDMDEQTSDVNQTAEETRSENNPGIYNVQHGQEANSLENTEQNSLELRQVMDSRSENTLPNCFTKDDEVAITVVEENNVNANIKDEEILSQTDAKEMQQKLLEAYAEKEAECLAAETLKHLGTLQQQTIEEKNKSQSEISNTKENDNSNANESDGGVADTQQDSDDQRNIGLDLGSKVNDFAGSLVAQHMVEAINSQQLSTSQIHKSDTTDMVEMQDAAKALPEGKTTDGQVSHEMPIITNEQVDATEQEPCSGTEMQYTA